MISHLEKSIDLATKISTKAEGALDSLEREMIVMKWPAEFRVIMWEAVAAVATIRARQAKSPK